jgi:hypothetical protein
METKKSLLLLFLLYCPVGAIEVDLEGSLEHHSTDYAFSLEKASLGIKEVFSDEKGDRVLFFAKLEAEDGFNETHIDQLYTKYKGPMGRWNIALGRSRIPFGLLSDYDAEMLLLETQEEKTIGYRSDDGIHLSGFWKSMDYELLVSTGKWFKNEDKDDKDEMLSFKSSFKGEDIEDFQLGFSFFLGELQGIDKELFAIDVTKYHGLLVSRNEVVVGKQNEENLLSVFSGLDYTLAPSLDLNVAYSYYDATYQEASAFLGLSYHSPWYGLVFRTGNTHYFKHSTKENQNEFLIQIYKSYSHYF